MQSTYKAFVDRLIGKYEGGYGWNKKDPGGPTNFGITCFDLAAHRHQKMTSMAAWAKPVQQMQLAEAEAIYAEKYATAIQYDALPAGVDACMMDYGVNSGPARAITVATALVGLKAGHMDAALISKIEHMGATAFINKMCDERLRFMHSLKGGKMWAEFGHGWQRRVDDLRAYCLHLASGSTAPAPTAVELGHVDTPKATNEAKSATAPTSVTAVAAAGSAYASGFPWWAIAAAIAVVLVAGVLYEVIQEHNAATANNTVHV